jgi:hypothetical protein
LDAGKIAEDYWIDIVYKNIEKFLYDVLMNHSKEVYEESTENQN